jgi:hypothetical protein
MSAAASPPSIASGATGWSGAESEGPLAPISASVARIVAENRSCDVFVESVGVGVGIAFPPGIFAVLLLSAFPFGGAATRPSITGHVPGKPGQSQLTLF